MRNLLTQVNLAPKGGFKGIGEGPLSSGANAVQTFTNFISSVIGLITIIGIIWFVFILITGAIGMMGAGGDKQAMETARKRISSGLIGLVVIIAGVFIVDLIGTLLGIPNILDLPGLVKSLPLGSGQLK